MPKSFLKLYFYYCLIFAVPLAFFAGLFSLKIFVLAPLLSAVFLIYGVLRLSKLYSQVFPEERLTDELKESLQTSAKIALAQHSLPFEIRVFDQTEAAAFSLRGFQSHERFIYLSSGLCRTANEELLRAVIRELAARLLKPEYSWMAYFTWIYLSVLPVSIEERNSKARNPILIFRNAIQLSFARTILKLINVTENNASQDFQMTHKALNKHSTSNDAVFLSPLFLPSNPSFEYGSLESILIRE